MRFDIEMAFILLFSDNWVVELNFSCSVMKLKLVDINLINVLVAVSILSMLRIWLWLEVQRKKIF